MNGLTRTSALAAVSHAASSCRGRFASLSVAENLRVPLLYTVNARSGPHLSAAEIEARTAELLSLVGLATGAANSHAT